MMMMVIMVILLPGWC